MRSARSVVVPSVVPNATYHTVQDWYSAGYSLAGSTPAAVVGPSTPLRTQHNPLTDHVVGGRRVEPAAPSPVVPPASGGDPVAAPPLNPPVLFGAGNPRPLQAPVLPEGDDVAHVADSTPWLYPDRYGRSVCDRCDTVSHASIADHLAERHPQVHAECGAEWSEHDNREPGRTLPFGCLGVAS